MRPLDALFYLKFTSLQGSRIVSKLTFEAQNLSKTRLTTPKWPRKTQVTILDTYLNFIFWAKNSWFSVQNGGLEYEAAGTVLWPSWTSLQEARFITKIIFDAPKLSKTCLTCLKWPRNILGTILDPYRERLWKSKNCFSQSGAWDSVRSLRPLLT